MDMQDVINAMNASSKATRGRYQMTLGKLIDALDRFDDSLSVIYGGADTGAPHTERSYRGYYSDLSFDTSSAPVSVAEFKKLCKQALGSVYQGYKGGDFVMSRDTPVWVAQYGCCGNAIMDAVEAGGKIVLVTKDVEGE